MGYKGGLLAGEDAGVRGWELQHHARGTNGTVPQCAPCHGAVQAVQTRLGPRQAACCAIEGYGS